MKSNLLFFILFCSLSVRAFATECRLLPEMSGDPFAGIAFHENPSLEGIAQAWSSQAVVEFNPRELAKRALHVQDFIMLHETGHIRLLHAARFPGNSTDLKTAELEADSWAACRWIKRWRNRDLINDVFEELRGQPADFRHPSGNKRISNIRESIAP
jgi:hypothetical protein